MIMELSGDAGNKMNECFGSPQAELAMIRNAVSTQGKINNYLRWNLSLFPIQNNKSILELGCGLGTYYQEIKQYSPSLYVATDYSGNYVERVRSAFGNDPSFKAAQFDLLDPQSVSSLSSYKFDYVLLFDVLEHIKNERLALENIRKIMKSCDIKLLFLRVPALKFIYGTNDAAIGHYRRYSPKPLKALLNDCLFDVKLLRYQNFAGIMPWYINGNILKRTLAVSGTEGKLFDYMVPALRFIEEIIQPPLGLSLNCVCTIRN